MGGKIPGLITNIEAANEEKLRIIEEFWSQERKKRTLEIQIYCIGDCNCGKTTFINSIKGVSEKQPKLTIGQEAITIESMYNDRPVKIHIMASAPGYFYENEQFEYATKNTDAFWIVNDISREMSEKCSELIQSIDNGKKVQCIFTKTDIAELVPSAQEEKARNVIASSKKFSHSPLHIDEENIFLCSLEQGKNEIKSLKEPNEILKPNDVLSKLTAELLPEKEESEKQEFIDEHAVNFEKFVVAYKKNFPKGLMGDFKKWWSSMNQKLDNQEINKIEDIQDYAKAKPDSRTAKVLKQLNSEFEAKVSKSIS